MTTINRWVLAGRNSEYYEKLEGRREEEKLAKEWLHPSVCYEEHRDREPWILGRGWVNTLRPIGEMRVEDILKIEKHRGAWRWEDRYSALSMLSKALVEAGTPRGEIYEQVSAMARRCEPCFVKSRGENEVVRLTNKHLGRIGIFPTVIFASELQVTIEEAEELELSSIVPTGVEDALSARGWNWYSRWKGWDN